MDEHGLEWIWLFPTLGVLYEELLKHDAEAVTLTFTAFNRWLDEDWGCNYRRPHLRRALHLARATSTGRSASSSGRSSRDARVVVMRPAAPTTAFGPRSPGDPMFDPFWARVERSRASPSSCTPATAATRRRATPSDGVRRERSTRRARRKPSVRMFAIERAAYDFLISLMFDKLFDALPEPAGRVGRERLGVPRATCSRSCASTRQQDAGLLRATTRPTSSASTCWINPFWEDDVYEVADLMGADRVIFGSDWPHIEGMPKPLDYVTELKELDDDSQRSHPARQRARAERRGRPA